jgi:hypothetical protein
MLRHRDRATYELVQDNELGEKLARRIDRLGKFKNLPITSSIDVILRVWTTFLGLENPRSWVKSVMTDANAFCKLAFSQMSEASSSAPPYKYRELHGPMDEEVFDLPDMLEAAERHLSSGLVSAADQDNLQRFIEGLRSRIPEPEATRSAAPP